MSELVFEGELMLARKDLPGRFVDEMMGMCR